MAGFREALAVVLEAEGALSDGLHDPGGRTNYGISTPVWERWRVRLGKPNQPVDACTLEDAERIYWEDYWMVGRCNVLGWPLAMVHFDSTVQHGVAAKLLQQAIGARDDGVIGTRTLARADQWDAKAAAEALLWVRLAYYRQLPNWPYAGRGWVGRMVTLRRYVVGTLPLPRVA